MMKAVLQPVNHPSSQVLWKRHDSLQSLSSLSCTAQSPMLHSNSWQTAVRSHAILRNQKALTGRAMRCNASPQSTALLTRMQTVAVSTGHKSCLRSLHPQGIMCSAPLQPGVAQMPYHARSGVSR